MSGPQYDRSGYGTQEEAAQVNPAMALRSLAAAEGTRNACDPWQNRSTKMLCASCMWFAQKAGNVGRCRRHAPTMSGYPVVFKTDWCGDHKLNEIT